MWEVRSTCTVSPQINYTHVIRTVYSHILAHAPMDEKLVLWDKNKPKIVSVPILYILQFTSGLPILDYKCMFSYRYIIWA